MKSSGIHQLKGTPEKAHHTITRETKAHWHQISYFCDCKSVYKLAELLWLGTDSSTPPHISVSSVYENEQGSKIWREDWRDVTDRLEERVRESGCWAQIIKLPLEQQRKLLLYAGCWRTAAFPGINKLSRDSEALETQRPSVIVACCSNIYCDSKVETAETFVVMDRSSSCRPASQCR